MGRADGFRLMDVSTTIANDPKFRRLQRQHPGLVAAAFTAYVALLGESWHAGRRVSLDDAWPAILPFDAEVGPALVDAGLLDRRGLIAAKAWAGYFGPAHARQAASLARWARANAKRANPSIEPVSRTDYRDDTASSPRDDNAATALLPRGNREVTRPPVLTGPVLTRPARGRVPAREAEAAEAHEWPALTWLANHGCYVRPGNGYHGKLVTATERHGVEAIVDAFEHLAASGLPNGDVKGFVFGAIDGLDAVKRPNLKAVESKERADEESKAHRRRVEATLVRNHETGAHTEPHPACPACTSEAGAAGVIHELDDQSSSPPAASAAIEESDHGHRQQGQRERRSPAGAERTA